MEPCQYNNNYKNYEKYEKDRILKKPAASTRTNVRSNKQIKPKGNWK